MDNDLKFLSKCKSSDLMMICDCLTKPISESLSKKESYKKYYPNKLHLMVEDIATELQLFGGDTKMNLLRSILGKEPIPYREVLCDVCDKFDVKYTKGDSVSKIEKKFITQLFEKSWSKLSWDEKQKLGAEYGFNSFDVAKIVGVVGLPLISAMVAESTVVATLGLLGATSGGIMMSALAGPIGLLMAGIIFGGPNYKVTIPCVAQIASMRMNLNNDSQLGKSSQIVTTPIPTNEQRRETIKKFFYILGIENSGKKSFESSWEKKEYETKDGKFINVATHVFSGNIKEHTNWENVLSSNNCIYFVFDFYKYYNDDAYKNITDEQILHFFKKAFEKNFDFSKLITIASHYDSFPDPKPNKKEVQEKLNGCNRDYSKIMCSNLYLLNLSDTDKVQKMIQNEIINNNIL